MDFVEVFLIGIALSMDAFAVAVCKGLSVSLLSKKNVLITALYFGIFQAVMPLVGFILGAGFEHIIKQYDHWIAFVLLGLIGLNMIKEAFGEDECLNCVFDIKTMVPLAVATSIDALATGVVFACTQGASFPILKAVSIIGVTTFLFSALGIKIGNVFGARYRSKAELFGGVVLVLMGVKILCEHMGWI